MWIWMSGNIIYLPCNQIQWIMIEHIDLVFCVHDWVGGINHNLSVADG